MNRYSLSINGQSVFAANSFEVKNPATEETLGHAPVSSPGDVAEAIAAARAAQPSWAARPDSERKEILMKVAQVLEDNSEHLATWITKEQGKPLAGPGSMFEMQACVGWTQVPASLDLPVEVVFEDETRRDELHRKPIGVIGAIAPWNWPLMIAIWQIIPSLRAGNTVVIKPSEYTTLSSLEMIRLMNTVLPEGVLNVISGDGKVGALLVESEDETKFSLLSQKTSPFGFMPSTRSVFSSGSILEIVIVPSAISSFNSERFSTFSEVIKIGVSANPTILPFLSIDNLKTVN